MFAFSKCRKVATNTPFLLTLSLFQPYSIGQSLQKIAVTSLPAVGIVGVANSTAASRNSIKVTYSDGLLAIDADNSTLADVLKAVAEKTGAHISVPPGSGLDRIVEHSGPGPAEVILAHLLNGSGFSFVIVTSPDSPRMLSSVVLLSNGAPAPVVTETQPASDATAANAEPQVYGAGFSLSPEEEEAAAQEEAANAATKEADAGNPSDGRLPSVELDRMQKERLKQRQEQMQQAQQAQQEHNN